MTILNWDILKVNIFHKKQFHCLNVLIAIEYCSIVKVVESEEFAKDLIL